MPKHSDSESHAYNWRNRHEQAKVHAVMSEFKEGTLKSSGGQKVTKRDQAVAIAMSEAGLSKKKRKGK